MPPLRRSSRLSPPSKSSPKKASPQKSPPKSAAGPSGVTSASPSKAAHPRKPTKHDSNPGLRALEAAFTIVRDVDWARNKHGEPLVQTILSLPHQGAVALQRRGEVQLDCCDHCVLHGPFVACVAGPVYRGSAVFSGSCASCVWNNKASTCTFRASRNLADWQDVLTEEIVTIGSFEEALVRSLRLDEDPVVGSGGRRKRGTFTPMPLFPPRIGIIRPLDPASAAAANPLDGEVLRWGIPRAIWSNSDALLAAARDLATMREVVLRRCGELGVVNEASNVSFWTEEANQLNSLAAGDSARAPITLSPLLGSPFPARSLSVASDDVFRPPQLPRPRFADSTPSPSKKRRLEVEGSPVFEMSGGVGSLELGSSASAEGSGGEENNSSKGDEDEEMD